LGNEEGSTLVGCQVKKKST